MESSHVPETWLLNAPPPLDQAELSLPLGASPRSDSNELSEGLLDHVVATGRAAVAGHVACAVVVAGVLWHHAPGYAVVSWLAAVITIAIGRWILFRRTNRNRATLRLAAVTNALAWGLGPLMLGTHLTLPAVLLLMVVLAGLVAAGTVTLAGDAIGFYAYLAAILVPLQVALILHGNSQTHYAAIGFVALFGMVATQIHRTARRELIGRLEATMQARRSEERAAHDRAFLRSLLESSPTATATIDRFGVVLNVNPAFERLFEYPREEAEGRRLNDLIVPPNERTIASHLDDEVNAGRIVVIEGPRCRRDGSELLVRISAAAASGAAQGSIFILYDDVTRLREGEQRIRAALEEARGTAERADRAKTAFLANMSHEIRTPLNGVLGMVEVLLGGSLSGDERRIAMVIRESGQSLLAIINDVLDLSKIEAGKLELESAPFEPAHAVDSVVRLFQGQASAKGLNLTASIEPDVATRLVGDVGRLRQILANLVGNAVKFTERGSVFVTVSNGPSSGPNPTTVFSVRDTGIGIPDDKLSHIFEEFAQADGSTTRKYGGTGLGLTISRRLAAMMGGQLIAESQSGRGSDFRLVVPLTPAAVEPAAVAGPSTPARGDAKLRILIAEDNPVNQRVAATLLRRRGHHVDVVDNGRLAVDAVRATPYDVVLMDVQMPELDGLGATREIRADPAVASLPIVACTAHALQQERAECFDAGVNGYLTKPFKPEDLFDAVERLAPVRPPAA